MVTLTLCNIIILQGLSQVDEMLISLVIPIMSVYRLPHGQYGYKGHVINLQQDITVFATSLPKISKELDILIVMKKGSDNFHRDFSRGARKSPAPIGNRVGKAQDM